MKVDFSATPKPVVAILVKTLFCFFACFQAAKAYVSVGLREGSPRKRRQGYALGDTEESGLE